MSRDKKIEALLHDLKELLILTSRKTLDKDFNWTMNDIREDIDLALSWFKTLENEIKNLNIKKA